jgi:hypothetical protein
MDDNQEECDCSTGPFCRHWNDPSACEEKCARCGHSCSDHGSVGSGTPCAADGCDCPGWIGENEIDTPPGNKP